MAIKCIFEAVVQLNMPAIVGLVQSEIDAGESIDSILNNGLISAMDQIGNRFTAGSIFIPEMLMAAQTMKAGLDVLRPHLIKKNTNQFGTIIIGSVKGDLHDIGKNLVAMMLEGAGFNVIDIGVDAGPEKFIAAAWEHQAQIIALSALLTTTMPEMENTVQAIRSNAVPAKTIIGGAPVTNDFSDKIGAGGYAADAPSAVLLVRDLLDLQGTRL